MNRIYRKRVAKWNNVIDVDKNVNDDSETQEMPK